MVGSNKVWIEKLSSSNVFTGMVDKYIPTCIQYTVAYSRMEPTKVYKTRPDCPYRVRVRLAERRHSVVYSKSSVALLERPVESAGNQ